MSIKALIEEIDDFNTAIESIEVLVVNHNQEVLKPTLNYLNEQRRIVVKKLSNFKINIEVQSEEIDRLSHI
ncbi:hypothetical protein ACM55F_10140 [Flavobacterium sp. XS2P12]|uniref:hypothetical protein n=1 Tax=Flavobacterium melibiosi TaxID=3398734 RepID=UPI003A8B8767